MTALLAIHCNFTALPLSTHECAHLSMCMWHMEVRNRRLVSLTHNHAWTVFRVTHCTLDSQQVLLCFPVLRIMCRGSEPLVCTASTLPRGISPSSDVYFASGIFIKPWQASSACSPFSTHHLVEHHRSGMPNSSPPIITLGTLVLRNLEPRATRDLLGVKTTTRVSYSLRFLNLSLFSSQNSHGLQGLANHKYCSVTVHLHEASQLGNTRHTLSFFAILVLAPLSTVARESFKYQQWFRSWQRVGMPN